MGERTARMWTVLGQIEPGLMVGEVQLTEPVIVTIVIAGAIVLMSIAKAVAGTFRHAARERTRREIAAYIAEGSMTPEQGERLMRGEASEKA